MPANSQAQAAPACTSTWCLNDWVDRWTEGAYVLYRSSDNGILIGQRYNAVPSAGTKFASLNFNKSSADSLRMRSIHFEYRVLQDGARSGDWLPVDALSGRGTATVRVDNPGATGRIQQRTVVTVEAVFYGIKMERTKTYYGEPVEYDQTLICSSASSERWKVSYLRSNQAGAAVRKYVSPDDQNIADCATNDWADEGLVYQGPGMQPEWLHLPRPAGIQLQQV